MKLLLLRRRKTKLVLVLFLRKQTNDDRNPRVLLISSCLRMNHARCRVRPAPHLQIRIVAGGAGRITSRVPPGSNCITGEMIISDFLIMFFCVTVKDDSSPTKNHWFSLDRPLEWPEISNRNSCRLVLHSLSFTLQGFRLDFMSCFHCGPNRKFFGFVNKVAVAAILTVSP